MTTISRFFLRTTSLATLVLALSAGQALAQPEPGMEDTAGDDTMAGDDTTAGAPMPDPMADAPRPTPEPGEGGGQAGYKKGFFIESSDGNFQLRTQARVQGRFTLESEKVVDTREEDANFRINRARLTLGGHAFSKNIGFKFQTDFGKGNVVLKDYYVDYNMNGIHVRTGQWKRPFSRQQINSSGRLELVDRAITDKAFGAGRDIGMAVHNNYEKSPDLEWAVGVFNAQAADSPVLDIDAGKYSNYPALFGPAIAGRVGINRGGIKGYSEADLEGGPLRFGAAASLVVDLGIDEDNGGGAILGEADFIAKVNGISASAAVYVSTAEGVDGFFDQAKDSLGFHVQGGYMLTPEHQVAARFALVNKPDPNVVDDTLNDLEVLVGHSMYMFAHGFKWQTDVGFLALDGASLGDAIVARTQLQLSF